ncbi:ABC transporter permease [Flavihumibacter stibioxidans]|uniref:Peptide transporter n=1 Tax=Flavihumibacter stibioxidans TaxID=1834163 RepID=A0ABR7MB63_9BACT|nr:ABC transporter permease [Flavihumibacter stibioxidans]MBC6491965.1 peptide transporter [Flavihumibacter stibioxidans]
MTGNEPTSAWRKLLHNKGAVIGIVIIVIALLTALLAYWLAPDSTPDANRMMVEIGGRKPGFTQQFFLLPKEPAVAKVNWLDRTLHGQPDMHLFIPVSTYEIKDGQVILQKYIDDGITEPVTYSLAGWQQPVEQLFVSKTFLLGTDKYGRDILSRLIIGVRVSLLVGGIAMLLSLSIGLLLGALAGYYGGRWDNWIMWFINVIWSIPTLLLVFAITLLLGKGFWQVFIAVGLTMWVNVARIVRGQLLAIRHLEYVEAARVLGYKDLRIIVKHILPNIIGPVLVVAAANFASAIVVEAGLSFLGVGVQPPQPSWGGMIKENYNFIITNNPMLALAPGFAIMFLVLAFNLLGNGIRDALDVRN